MLDSDQQPNSKAHIVIVNIERGWDASTNILTYVHMYRYIPVRLISILSV